MNFQVIHPQQPYQSIRQEDMFLAVNEMGVQMGSGYVQYQFQPHLYPDKPVNIYFHMDCTPEAEYCIFGALVARARALRQQNPGVAGRLYTSVGPDEERKIDFFSHNGMQMTNGEDLVQLQLPDDTGAERFNCSVITLPISGPQDLQSLVQRLHQNGLEHITLPLLQDMAARYPGMLRVWGLLYGKDLVSECIVAGYPGAAELLGIYTTPMQRRSCMAKHLLHRVLGILRQEGTVDVTARIMTASEPQVRLMNDFGAVKKESLLLFPSLDI